MPMSRSKIYFVVVPVAVVLAVFLLIVLSDRHVTDAVPLLRSVMVRWIVGLAIMMAGGRLVRAALVSRAPASGAR